MLTLWLPKPHQLLCRWTLRVYYNGSVLTLINYLHLFQIWLRPYKNCLFPIVESYHIRSTDNLDDLTSICMLVCQLLENNCRESCLFPYKCREMYIGLWYDVIRYFLWSRKFLVPPLKLTVIFNNCKSYMWKQYRHLRIKRFYL